MNDAELTDRPRGSSMRIPRTRGAASGLFLIVLGLWGALIPFVGPLFEYSYSPGQQWTAARGLLEVLPGVVTVLGGILLLMSNNRAKAMLGGWLAVLGGVWFVVGRTLADVLNIGDVGTPVGASEAKLAAVELGYFSGLGALIVFLGSIALGRLSVRTLRDVEYARRPIEPVVADEPATTAVPVEREPVAAADREPVLTKPAAAQPDVTDRRTEPIGPTMAANRHAVVEEERPRRGLAGLFRRRKTTETTVPR